MKTSIGLSALLLVGVLGSAAAEIVPLKIETTVKPPLSPVMLMDGVTSGQVRFAIDVDEHGRLTDYLVLGASHPGLIAPCSEALKEWKITPARMNGKPMPVQTELTVDYTAEGVVISRTAAIDIEGYLQRIFGPRLNRPSRLSPHIDAIPARTNTVEPAYSKEAADRGVRGTVQVHFYIDESGAVRMPAVEDSPDPYLSEIAVAAVREWRFEPPTSRGKPVLIAARQEFNFGK